MQGWHPSTDICEEHVASPSCGTSRKRHLSYERLVEAPCIRYAISALLTLEIPMIPQGEQVFAEAENVATPRHWHALAFGRRWPLGVSKAKQKPPGRRWTLMGESRHGDHRLNILIIISGAAQSEVAHPCPFVLAEKVAQRWCRVGTRDWSDIRHLCRTPRLGMLVGC